MQTNVPVVTAIYYGPMKSGKSRYLVEKAESFLAQDLSFLAFKPLLDTRDGAFIRSRYPQCRHVQALTVDSSRALLQQVRNAREHPASFRPQLPEAPAETLALHESFKAKAPLEAILIDEVFLLDAELPEVIQQFQEWGISVYMSGLDRDFRGEFFPLRNLGERHLSMKEIIELSEQQMALVAECEVCRQPAALTQRLINGAPAPYDSPTVLIGDEEYQPRCRQHHVVTGKPLTVAS